MGIYLRTEVENVETAVIEAVKVAEAAFHIVVAHLAFHHTELGVHKLTPQSLPRTPNVAMFGIVESRVTHTLETLGDIHTRKSDQ
jgi:hypothetical protein